MLEIVPSNQFKKDLKIVSFSDGYAFGSFLRTRTSNGRGCCPIIYLDDFATSPVYRIFSAVSR